MNKISFIKHTLPYLKLLRDNIYVSNIKLFKNELAVTSVPTITCVFTFSPFADKSSLDIILFVAEDEPDLPVLMYYDDATKNNPSKLVDDYFSNFMFPKYMKFEDFKKLIEGVHDYAIDILMKMHIGSSSNKSLDIEIIKNLIKKYIPSTFISNEDLTDYIKSRKALSKYNL